MTKRFSDSFMRTVVPGLSSRRSSSMVISFIAIKMSLRERCASQPCSFTRMVNHVGRPAMFDGKRFLPLTGMPIPKIACSNIRLADWLPEPFFVIATQNPYEHHGTYPLPENQLDRFMLCTAIGYPDRIVERGVLDAHRSGDAVNDLKPVVSQEQLLSLQRAAR